MRYVLTLLALAILAAKAEAQACSALLEDRVIEVEVAWRFASADLNQLWIAEAIQPRLEVPRFLAKRMDQELEDGGFRSTFCLVPQEAGAALERLELFLGQEELALKARPIQWSSEPSLAPSKPAVQYGRMTTIHVPARPDLKATLCGNATLLHTDQDEPRLKVDCLNTGGLPHLGVRFAFAVENPCVSVGSPLGAARLWLVPIRIRFGRSGVDIFGGDPAFPGELFRRELSYTKGCRGKRRFFKLDLGEVGALAPGLNTIRYAFTLEGEPKGEPSTGLWAALAPDRFSLTDAFQSGAKALTVEGENVFPRSIPVTSR